MAAADSDQLFPLFSVTERRGRAARNLPITFGVPLPRGSCFDHRKLALIDGNANELPASISVSALWSDNSIQWCLVRSTVDLASNETLTLGFGRRLPLHEAGAQQTLVHDEGHQLRVDAGQRSLLIDTKTLRLFNSDTPGLRGRVSLGYQGAKLCGRVEDYDYRTLLTQNGALCADVNLRGSFEPGNGQRLAFSCSLKIAASGERIDASLTLHNPAAARHPEGLWDLGDAHSLFFDSLSLGLHWDTESNQTYAGLLQINHDQAALKFSRQMLLTQYASGGPHWNSPVHQNHQGEVTLTEPGFVAQIDDEEIRGKRADPIVQIDRGAHRLSVRPDDFWQRFPSQLAVESDGITVGLLPDIGTAHELQAGERCTHRCTFLFADSMSPDDDQHAIADFATAQITLHVEHVQSCALPELGATVDVDPRIQQLISQGLNGDNSFVNKREAIDEYGWRNFGDLWADHETEGYDGKPLFVSHYNNQYDPLFGFLRQYLRSGERQWLDLASDLARHTVDIDIYHTEEDRPEYNHGLFWHTDHYLPAETSSHRSYSRRQPKHAYEGHARGGGPGGQHGYTTGLLYHYLLTGDRASRDALYGLKDWIGRVYEGSGTLTDVVLALKNRNRPDLKNHLTGQYPLDRGVANYLHALMDCYALDRAPTTLTRLAAIIRHTIHPAEDLDARALNNVEEHWFYVVLLQALCRYLLLKVDVQELDEDFVYARDCLLHYSDWMVANEAPYLDKPEILEFPNHTWTAQDLRKANVLFWAAYWSTAGSGQDSAVYAAKATGFVDYIAHALHDEPSRQYTRILALLMQNEYPSRAVTKSQVQAPERARHPAPRPVGTLAQTRNLGALLLRALRQFRPAQEVAAVRRVLPVRGEQGEAP